MTERQIPLAGVVGWPVKHSKSPILYKHWLQKYQIAGHFVPIPLSPRDFEVGIMALPKLGFIGVNVTIPHKEIALKYATSVTDRAALIGAANTLTFNKDGGYLADNTDGVGFLENVKQIQPAWRADAGPSVVIGAGGAARAVVSALLGDGAPEVTVVNRTMARAVALQEHFGARVIAVAWHSMPEILESAATIVNTTSLGMEGNPPSNISLDKAPQTALVTDIVYTPLETDLLKSARARGHPVVDGLGMLLHQAVPGFEAWFGRRPEVDDSLRSAILSA